MAYTTHNQELLSLMQHPAFEHLANNSNQAFLIQTLENLTKLHHHNKSIDLENIISIIPQLDAQSETDPLSVIILITVFYSFIFVAGILGNVMTCVIIFKNKHMHTATNYYLFNLAVSDFLLLVIGLPLDLYNIWNPNSFPFNETTCIFQGLLLETVTNVTILTITSFSVERYIAICHPFRSHAMSKLSRAIKFIVGIWIGAFLLATPQSFLFGVIVEESSRVCSIKTSSINGYFFEVSSFLFFIGPLFVISILYIRIGMKLKNSTMFENTMQHSDFEHRNTNVKAQTRVIRMLIAVVVAFMLCWFPFHAQRLMAVYGKAMSADTEFKPDQLFMRVYVILTYISGVMYFLSTCINPLLYNIMSNKFRAASKKTLQPYCSKCCCYTPHSNHSYTGISIHQSMFRTKKPPPKPRRLTIPFVKQDSSSSVTTQLTLNLNTPVTETFSNQTTPPLTACSYISTTCRNGSPTKLNGNKSVYNETVEKDENRSRFEFKMAKAKIESSLRESEEDRYL